MNEIIKQVNTSIAAANDHYAIAAFKKSLAKRQERAQEIVTRAARVVLSTSEATAVIAPLAEKPGVRYVVDASSAMKEALDNGAIKFDTNKAGEMFAQVRQADGHFGSKVPIKKELIKQGINPVDAANAMQLQSIQDQLEEIAKTLESISEDIAEVIQGQQNDRLGLYYSGLNLYLESQQVQDNGFRQLISSQAIKALSDASSQMTLALQSDTQYLLEKKYDSKKTKKAAEIEARMASINKCFEAIHRSYVLKAAVYFDMGETSAMLATIEEYGRFITSTIVPNAPKLSEYDVNDILLKDGIWEKRSASIAGVEEIRAQLADSTTYYLETSNNEENEDER